MKKLLRLFLIVSAFLFNFQENALAERDDVFSGSAVDRYLGKLNANELKSIVSLNEIGALVPSNDMLGSELKGLLSNLGIASELKNKIDELKSVRGIVPDTFGLDMDISALQDLIKTGEQFSSLQMLIGGELSPEELLTAINTSKILDGALEGATNLLSSVTTDILGDLPQLTGHLSALVNVVEGFQIPGIDMSVFGNIDFNLDDQIDLVRSLGLSRGMEDILAQLDPKELTALVNLKDLGVLMDMKDLFSSDLKSILDNPLRLAEFTQGLEALKINLGFLSDNFGIGILEDATQLQQLTQLMEPLQQFASLKDMFEGSFTPESVLGMVNVVDHLKEGITLPKLFSSNVISEMNFDGAVPNKMSALNKEVTGSPIPDVTPDASGPITDPSSMFDGADGKCSLKEIMLVTSCTESAGVKDANKRHYCAGNVYGARGRYQFMNAASGIDTLSTLPSSCYSGPRDADSSEFMCSPPNCHPVDGASKPTCQKNQDDAMKCFTADNKRKLKASGAYDQIGKTVCQTKTVGGGGKDCKAIGARLQAAGRTNTHGPKCVKVTEAGLLKAAHLGGSGSAKRRDGAWGAVMDGRNVCDGGCGCLFWYLADGAAKEEDGCDGEDKPESEEQELCKYKPTTGDPVDPDDPDDPGDPTDDDDPEEPDDPPLIPGTPGFGSGGDDKGLKTNFTRGGFRNFEATSMDAAAKGGSIESGTSASDDKSVKDVTDAASRYKTEDDFDFEETMAWIDDFEQFLMPPNNLSKTCWYYKRKFLKIKIMILPACSVKVNYSEPTAMVEVVGEPGLSYLGDLDDLVAKTEHSDGGVGAGLHGLSFNEAHVFGIPPVSRVKSSGSTTSKRRSFTCDVAATLSPKTWKNLVNYDLIQPNIDAATLLPDHLFEKTLPVIVSELEVPARTQWYMGAPDKGKDTPLLLLFASEERRPDWVEKTASHGDITSGSLPCDQDGRIDADKMTASGVPNKSDKKCVGSWGLLEPMTGFGFSNNDLIDKALVAVRAYSIAKQEKIYPMRAPAPTDGRYIPKIEYAHIGWKYWYTDFNIEWPYEGKQRFMLGEDGFNWDSVLQKNHYKSRGLSKWLEEDLTAGYGSDAMSKDGLVMTMWKKTTCRIYACCQPYPYIGPFRGWKVLKIINKAWKFKGVDEIDDWNTKHSRDFNPARM